MVLVFLSWVRVSLSCFLGKKFWSQWQVKGKVLQFFFMCIKSFLVWSIFMGLLWRYMKMSVGGILMICLVLVVVKGFIVKMLFFWRMQVLVFLQILGMLMFVWSLQCLILWLFRFIIGLKFFFWMVFLMVLVMFFIIIFVLIVVIVFLSVFFVVFISLFFFIFILKVMVVFVMYLLM